MDCSNGNDSEVSVLSMNLVVPTPVLSTIDKAPRSSDVVTSLMVNCNQSLIAAGPVIVPTPERSSIAPPETATSCRLISLLFCKNPASMFCNNDRSNTVPKSDAVNKFHVYVATV